MEELHYRNIKWSLATDLEKPSSCRNLPPTAELYGSGCENHLSPYRHLFQNFEDTAPRKFRAANQQMFSQLERENWRWTYLMKSTTTAKLCKRCLKDVHHSPKVGCAPISMGNLNEDDFTATFGNVGESARLIKVHKMWIKLTMRNSAAEECLHWIDSIDV